LRELKKKQKKRLDQRKTNGEKDLGAIRRSGRGPHDNIQWGAWERFQNHPNRKKLVSAPSSWADGKLTPGTVVHPALNGVVHGQKQNGNKGGKGCGLLGGDFGYQGR